MTLKGERVTQPIILPRSAVSVTFDVTADGYYPTTITVVPSHEQTLRFNMQPTTTTQSQPSTRRKYY
jgi:hypothetical protein